MLTSEQIAEGWIEHDGTGFPVRGDGATYAMLRCGMMGYVTPSAMAWVWERKIFTEGQYPVTLAKPTDIIAYRPEPTP